MLKYLLTALKYIFSIGLALSLFYYLYKDDDLTELASVFERAEASWLALSILAALTSHLSRALRWKIALKPLGHSPKIQTAFLAVMSTYFVNLFIPRLGEVVRAGLLRRTDDVPIEQSFGSIIAERAIDLIMLMLLCIVTLWIEFEKIGDFVTEQVLSALLPLLGGKGIAIMGAIAVMGAMAIWAIWQNRSRWGWIQKIWSIIEGVKAGLLSIMRLSKVAQLEYVAHTIVIWVMYYLMGYLLFFCTPETAALPAVCGLTALMMGAIGMALPSPGGIGTYHLFVTAAFVAYNLSETTGRDFAFLMHSTQTLGVLFFGGISFGLALLIAQKKRKTQ